MKFKKLLIISTGVLLAFAGCKKDNNSNNNHPTNGNGTGTDTVKTTPPASTPYTLTETFEVGAAPGPKTAYADGNVQLSTGTWDFNLALLGQLPADVKDGAWTVRIETTGSIAMKFDIKGVTQVSVKHARYGTDPVSSWQMMESTDGGATYTQIGSTITETTSTTFTTDSFKVTPAPSVRFKIQKASVSGTNRIDIDDITFKGTGDPGITLTDPTSGPDTTGTSTAALTRGAPFGSDAPPATGDNSNLLMGNPTSAGTTDMNNYLIDQHYYVESYNATRGEPNWVSWHLDASNVTNATGRADDFAGFNGLPSGWFVVQSNGYQGSVTGFDRGHNCPSADRTSSTNANDATFLMTNMIPQAPYNNQNTWANLENYIREQVLAGYEAYIIMGSYGTGGVGSTSTTATNTIDGGHVTVPSNIWKVAVLIPVGDGDVNRVTSGTRVIAVNTPNINTVNADWTQYITTVQAIETSGNVSLLTALPAAVKSALETKKDAGK